VYVKNIYVIVITIKELLERLISALLVKKVSTFRVPPEVNYLLDHISLCIICSGIILADFYLRQMNKKAK
jgi:uncharacterized membrane-anchored protein